MFNSDLFFLHYREMIAACVISVLTLKHCCQKVAIGGIMKKIIYLLGLLFIATAAFGESFTLKTADKTPCTVTLNGDFIVIEETLP